MKKLFVLGVVCLTFLVGSSVAKAGVYGDELTKCLVSSMDSKDKIKLAQWMGGAFTQHKAVASLVSVSPKKFLKITEEAGDVYLNLVFGVCLNETLNAIKYEGGAVFANSFKYVGQIVTRDLMLDADVQAAMNLLSVYFADKFDDVLKKNSDNN